MSEGTKPGYPDAYHPTVPQFSHRDSSPALNLTSTSKINGPDFSFLASHFSWCVAWSDAFNRYSQRS
jgi:hypothetical protein